MRPTVSDAAPAAWTAVSVRVTSAAHLCFSRKRMSQPSSVRLSEETVGGAVRKKEAECYGTGTKSCLPRPDVEPFKFQQSRVFLSFY